jgi:hypothetical protein
VCDRRNTELGCWLCVRFLSVGTKTVDCPTDGLRNNKAVLLTVFGQYFGDAGAIVTVTTPLIFCLV